MSLFSSNKPAPQAEATDVGVTNEKTLNDLAPPTRTDSRETDSIHKDAQSGVKNVEAITTVWTKWHLVAAYAFIWLIYFITSIQEVVIRSMTPFVTSSFEMHGFTATVGVMSSLFGGLSKLPIAKLLDTWGRPQGIAVTLLLWVVGFVMMAACKNVETYAAAQVFFSIGSQGVSYCLTVFIADTSSLKNRALMLAFATSPYIVTTWIGGPMSEAILDGPGFRWGFGIFTIIVPVVVVPLIFLFLWNSRKAKKMGIVETKGGPLTLEKVKNFIIEVDLIGIIILAAGMALFLLAFNIYSYQKDQWKSPMIICMIIFGALLIIGFALYEKFLAPVKFIPVHLLADRTVFFGGMMFVFVFSQSAIWGSYFYSMLYVVYNQSVTNATYIGNIYRVGSCFASLIIGIFIRWSGRFKWSALFYALPLDLLGVGLMIAFRRPDVNIGYIVMTQIFVAFAGGPLVVAGEMAMMAPLDHQYVAVIIAILDLFCSIGSAIGSTISAAIWTGTFPVALKKYLPEGVDYLTYYADIEQQQAYPLGHPIRDGVNKAYAEAQRYMLITSLCLLAGGVVCVALWRDIKLKDRKQVAGNVV